MINQKNEWRYCHVVWQLARKGLIIDSDEDFNPDANNIKKIFKPDYEEEYKYRDILAYQLSINPDLDTFDKHILLHRILMLDKLLLYTNGENIGSDEYLEYLQMVSDCYEMLAALAGHDKTDDVEDIIAQIYVQKNFIENKKRHATPAGMINYDLMIFDIAEILYHFGAAEDDLFEPID